MNFRLFLVLLMFLVKAESNSNIITKLPNYDADLPFSLETGYIGVGNNQEVQLFYYFVQSQGTPSEDPILIWITGGPGCSSVIAFFFEAGPLEFSYSGYDGVNFDTLKLVDNPYAWTKSTNMIFLDGPVGTGFSYSKTAESTKSSDLLFADNIYEFLQRFLELDGHSNFSGNDIYIGGDGYSGNPIPIAILEILTGNKLLSSSQWNIINPVVNLKGYVLGNPGTDFTIDYNAQFTYANQFSFIPNNIYSDALRQCDGNFLTPANDECQSTVTTMNQLIANISPVAILEPACNELTFNISTAKQYFKDVYNGVKRKWCRKYIRSLSEIYLNEQSVQDALKVARDDVEETLYTWSFCNDTVDKVTYDKNAESVLGFHGLIAEISDLRGLIYSGDHSLSINFISTLKWIYDFKWTVNKTWRVWSLENDPSEVAGYTTKFTQGDFELTYATVKGGSHFAAENKVEECAEMFTRWLGKKAL